MDILTAVATTLGLIVKLFGAYYLLIGIFALLRRAIPTTAAPKTRFAVIIPARNEEAVIGNLIESLLKQNYPAELFDVYAAINNCTDKTALRASQAGAKVFSCYGEVRCKGDALNQSLEYLMSVDPQYDVFCVFDADNLVDSNFLLEMNSAFVNGAKVAKGRNEAKNPYDSWISGCYAIYFRMSNFLYNSARSNLGLSARLVGTGFAIHRNVLIQLGGWHTHTLTEDAEFAAICAEHGIKVAWVPKALAYDEEPNELGVSLRQRKRWCSGMVEVARAKLPDVCRSMRKKHKGLKFDSIMFQLNSFIQAIAFIPMLINLGIAILPHITPDEIILIFAQLMLAYAGGVALAAAIALISGDWDARIAKSVFTYPIFLATWLPLQLLAIIHTTQKWEEIRHNRGISIQELA